MDSVLIENCILILIVGAALGFDLKMAHGYYLHLRKRDQTTIPFHQWWLRENPVKPAVFAGFYLLGLAIINARNFSLAAPLVAVSPETWWVATITAVFGIMVALDLNVMRGYYKFRRQAGKIAESFFPWWFTASRIKLAMAVICYFCGVGMICSFDLSWLIAEVSVKSVPTTALVILALSLALAGVLAIDLKLAQNCYRTMKKREEISEPFRRWWFRKNLLKLFIMAGLYLMGLITTIYPPMTLDLPLYSLYLLFADPRLLAIFIVTVVALISLAFSLANARFLYRNIKGHSGGRLGLILWWADKNRTRLAVAGGGYLASLLAVFLLLPWMIGYVNSGPARYLASAGKLFQQQKYQEAAGAYRKALGKEPDNAGIHLALAQTLMKLGATKEAQRECQTALQLDPNSWRAHHEQAILALTVGDTPQALSAVLTARRLQPEASEPKVLLARIYTLRNEHGQAAVVLREMVNLTPDDKEHRILLITNALTRRDFDEANRVAEAGLSRSANPELLMLQATALQGLGRSAEAIAALRSAADLAPQSPQPHMAMAQFSRQVGNYRAAITACEEALRRDPNNYAAMNNLANLLADHDYDLDRASRLAAESCQRHPDYPSYLDTFGWINFRQGRYEQAIPLLRRAVTLKPSDPELRYHLGAALIRAGQREAGRTEVTQALKLSQHFPGSAQARALLADRPQRDSRS